MLSRDKYIPLLNLRQGGFNYSACAPFTKYCERIKAFRETGGLKHIHKNVLDKACFSDDAAYSDSKDLPKRTISDKILKNAVYEISKFLDIYKS